MYVIIIIGTQTSFLKKMINTKKSSRCEETITLGKKIYQEVLIFLEWGEDAAVRRQLSYSHLNNVAWICQFIHPPYVQCTLHQQQIKL